MIEVHLPGMTGEERNVVLEMIADLHLEMIVMEEVGEEVVEEIMMKQSSAVFWVAASKFNAPITLGASTRSKERLSRFSVKLPSIMPAA